MKIISLTLHFCQIKLITYLIFDSLYYQIGNQIFIPMDSSWNNRPLTTVLFADSLARFDQLLPVLYTMIIINNSLARFFFFFCRNIQFIKGRLYSHTPNYFSHTFLIFLIFFYQVLLVCRKY